MRSGRPSSFSQTEDKAEAPVDSARVTPWEFSGALGEIGLFKGDDLRDVDDRVSRQAAVSAAQEEVTRGRCQIEVRGDHGGDHGLDAARVEGVGLDDQNRPAAAGAGTLRCAQTGPPDH